MLEGLKKISQEIKQSFTGIEIYDLKLTKNHDNYYIKIKLDNLYDKNGSVNISTCEAFSKSFIETLDRRILEDSEGNQLPQDLTIENYTLEVSSAGAEREIKVPEELERFKQSPMKITFLENNKKKSKILTFVSIKSQNKVIFLEYKTKREKINVKQTIKEKKYVSIQLQDILKANLYLDF